MKQKQMKKYYLQGTAEEVKIGDMIVLDLSEDMPNGKVKHHHLECKFIPQIIPLLLKEGVLEAKNVNEKKQKPSESCDTAANMIRSLINDNKTLKSRVDALEKLVKEIGLLVAYNPSVNSPKSRRNAKKAGRE